MCGNKFKYQAINNIFAHSIEIVLLLINIIYVIMNTRPLLSMRRRAAHITQHLCGLRRGASMKTLATNALLLA